MKTHIAKVVIVTVLIFTGNFIFSVTNSELTKHKLSNDTSLCLIVKGKITKTKVSAGNSYTIELVDNSSIIQLKAVKAGAKFEFRLKKNHWYAVKIIEDGCLSKYISISTYNLPEMANDDMYLVNFDLDDPLSYFEAKYLDPDAVDFPLAIICYNKALDGFDYNKEYTRNIKTKCISDLENEHTRSGSRINHVTINIPCAESSIKMYDCEPLINPELMNTKKQNTAYVPFNWSRKYCKKITPLP